MAFCRLVFPILLLSVVSSYSAKVPVFLWGDLTKTSLKSNPFTTVETQEFDDILRQELKKDAFNVFFIEKTLSTEDLSRKNADGETAFPYLHANLDKSVYLPSVEQPLEALNNLADPVKVDHVELTENGLSAEIEPEGGKYLFISLKDAREGESRAEMLRRHNDFMEDIVPKLKERYTSVDAVYTAEFPSWTFPVSHSIVRRQAVTETATNVYGMNGTRLYAENITITSANDTIVLTNFNGATTNIDGDVQNTTMNFGDNSIMLTFRQTGGYWFFDLVTLSTGGAAPVSEALHPAADVHALLDFSYRCAESVAFTSVNETKDYTVTFKNIKVQPFFKETNTSEPFGDSFNCVGFFSVPIWSGLFVVLILLSITFYGIMMMMDIRTMDRFDDPKGKTITINAAE